MSKSKEELNALKEEVASVNKKLQELTPEELEQVSGGGNYRPQFYFRTTDVTGAIITPEGK